jgi:hypothetical protein
MREDRLREMAERWEAKAIYLSRYAKDGGVWRAVETKDVWRDMARAALTAARGGEGQ